jgi:hypothetical protein
MTLTKERVDNILIDFTFKNDEDLLKAKSSNPPLYDAIMGGLSFISRRFGTAQSGLKSVAVDEPVIDVSPVVIEPQAIISQPQPIVPDNVQGDDDLTESELKDAIKSLKPLAEFDDEIKMELKRLENNLKQIKKKKS